MWTCMRCICVRGVVKTYLERLRDFLGARRAHVVLVQVERRDRLVRLQEVRKRLDALVAARVAAQVELLDLGHRLEGLHEGVQAVRVEAVAPKVNLRDRSVAHALLRDHLDARALHLSARAVEDRVLWVVRLDGLHHLVGRQDLEGGLPPLARQRLLVVGVHVLVCVKRVCACERRFKRE